MQLLELLLVASDEYIHRTIDCQSRFFLFKTRVPFDGFAEGGFQSVDEVVRLCSSLPVRM